MKKTHIYTAKFSLQPARFAFFAGELEGVKTSIEAQISKAELMKDIDDILQNLDAPFDAKIQQVIAGIEAQNAAEKDPKKRKDVEAARAELKASKESLKGTLTALAEQAKKTIRAQAEKAAGDLARDVKRKPVDAEQNERAPNASAAAAKISDDAGLTDTSYEYSNDINDRKGTGDEFWSEDEMYEASKEILTAIYIEQGPDAAKAKAEELKKAESGRDIDEEDFIDIFKHEKTPLDLNSSDNDKRIIDKAADSRLTGRVYGFFYTSGEAFKDSQGNYDNELIAAYRDYLNKESALSFDRIQADATCRDAEINRIMSPSQWLQYYHSKDGKAAALKGKPEKIDLSTKTKEMYVNEMTDSITDIAVRDQMRSLLIGALGASKNTEDWPKIVTTTLASVGLKPDTINTATSEMLNKVGDKNFLDTEGGKVLNDSDYWADWYFQGLIYAAKQFYKGKEGGDEFVAAYKKYLSEEMLGEKGPLRPMLIAIGKEYENDPNDPNRLRMWEQMRKITDTPAEFWAKFHKEPEKPKEPEHKEGDIYQDGNTWKKWEGGKPVDVANGDSRQEGNKTYEWDATKKEWKEKKAAPATGGMRVAGGGAPAGQPGMRRTPETKDERTPGQRWEDFSTKSGTLAGKIAEAVAQNADDPSKIPGAVRAAAGQYYPQLQQNYSGEYLLPSGVGIKVGGGKVEVAGYAPDAAKKPANAPPLDARWTAPAKKETPPAQPA